MNLLGSFSKSMGFIGYYDLGGKLGFQMSMQIVGEHY
jgi:hypothetical protein